jgi:hypothetical protein
MTTYSNRGSLAGKLVTWFVVAVMAIAAIKVAFWAVSLALALGAFLLFTIGPILLVGWLVVKLARWLGRPGNDYDPVLE